MPLSDQVIHILNPLPIFDTAAPHAYDPAHLATAPVDVLRDAYDNAKPICDAWGTELGGRTATGERIDPEETRQFNLSVRILHDIRTHLRIPRTGRSGPAPPPPKPPPGTPGSGTRGDRIVLRAQALTALSGINESDLRANSTAQLEDFTKEMHPILKAWVSVKHSDDTALFDHCVSTLGDIAAILTARTPPKAPKPSRR